MNERVNGATVDLASVSAEPFRSLRLSLNLRSDTRRGNVLAFTSAEPGEGKSTIASNYAVVSSLNDSRVLLIDADVRKPQLHETFHVPRVPGLSDLFFGTIDPEDFIHAPNGKGGIAVLAAGSEYPRPGDLLTSRRMGEILADVSTRYDAVIIDTPPLLAVADAAGIAAQPNVDVVLVVDHSSGRRRSFAKAIRKLDLIGANLVGIVVNHEGTLAAYGYY